MKVLKLLFIGLFLMGSISGVNGQWQQDYVAATEETETDPAIAVDGNGVAHIVFLKYFSEGKGKNKTWAFKIFYRNADNNEFSDPVQITMMKKYLRRPVIALDNEGNVHVAVMDRTDNQVLYLTNAGELNLDGTWPYELVCGPGEWGRLYSRGIDIDIDGSGDAHISAIGTDVDTGVEYLYYATNTNGGFASQNLSSSCNIVDIKESSIDAVEADPNPQVHIGCTGYSSDTKESALYYLNGILGNFTAFTHGRSTFAAT